MCFAYVTQSEEGVDASGLGQGPVAGSRESDNKISDPTKGRELLN